MENIKELLEQAAAMQNDGICLKRTFHNTWSVISTSGSTEFDLVNVTFEEAIAKLKEWARPKELTLVRIPFEEAEAFAKEIPTRFPSIRSACLEAVRPFVANLM